MTRALQSIVFLGAIALSARSAGAQTWGISESTLEQLSFDATQSLLIGEVARDANGASGRGRRGKLDEPPSRGLVARPSSGGPRVPRQLAAAYPEASRAHAEQVFLQVLAANHQIESRFGLARYDVAGAMATFVAGTYMAWNDVEVPDAHFLALVAQLRGSLRANRSFRRASDLERQEMYETRSYLKQLLGVEPDQVLLNARGMSIRRLLPVTSLLRTRPLSGGRARRRAGCGRPGARRRCRGPRPGRGGPRGGARGCGAG